MIEQKMSKNLSSDVESLESRVDINLTRHERGNTHEKAIMAATSTSVLVFIFF